MNIDKGEIFYLHSVFLFHVECNKSGSSNRLLQETSIRVLSSASGSGSVYAEWPVYRYSLYM